MLERYTEYRIDRLIADYEDNKKALENLKVQLAAIDGFSGGQGGERVQSSPSADVLEKTVIKRVDMSRRVAEYERDLEIYENAWESLTEQEQFILTEFFCKNQSKIMTVEAIRSKYYIQPSRVYDLRREALKRMRKMIFGE